MKTLFNTKTIEKLTDRKYSFANTTICRMDNNPSLHYKSGLHDGESILMNALYQACDKNGIDQTTKKNIVDSIRKYINKTK